MVEEERIAEGSGRGEQRKLSSMRTIEIYNRCERRKRKDEERGNRDEEGVFGRR